MKDHTSTDFDWAPHQVKHGDWLKYGSSYREDEGTYPLQVVLKRGEPADPEFQVSGLKDYHVLWSYTGNSRSVVVEIDDELDDEISSLNAFSFPCHIFGLFGNEPDAYADSWRGIFPIQLKRKKLFSKEMEIEPSKLRKWKPRAYIDRHALELDDG